MRAVDQLFGLLGLLGLLRLLVHAPIFGAWRTHEKLSTMECSGNVMRAVDQLFELLGLLGLLRLLGTCADFWCLAHTRKVEYNGVLWKCDARCGPVIRVIRVIRVTPVIGYMRRFLVPGAHTKS